MGVFYKNFLIAIGIVLLMQSCGGLDDNNFVDSDELAREQEATILQFFDDNGITGAEQLNGTPIYFVRETTSTDGLLARNSVVGIYYTAAILDGNIFESHLPEDGESILLHQGVNAVIPVGLDMGLELMREGETYTFYIPSAFAYNVFEFSNIIPSNSIIQMVVSVDRVMSEADRLNEEVALINAFVEENELNDLDQNPTDEVRVLGTGVRFKRLEVGSGGVVPAVDQTVSLSFRGTLLNGRVFDETTGNATFSYTFGNEEVIPGFDEGVAEMVVGERSLVIIPSNSAYSESVRVIPAFFKEEFISNRIIPGFVAVIDPYEVLLFDLTLREIN